MLILFQFLLNMLEYLVKIDENIYYIISKL